MKSLRQRLLLVGVFVYAVVDPLAVMVQIFDTALALLAVADVFLND